MSVRHALLALLSEGPKYGLQLRQEFEARTGEVWPLNVGQVYTTLQRLERDGFVASDDTTDEGAQKNFQITAEGATELTRWLRLRTNVLQGSNTQQQVFQRAQGSGADLLFFFSY